MHGGIDRTRGENPMMSLRNIFFAALLCVISLAPALGAIGTIDSLEGDVRVATKAAERRAQAGMAINEGDTVKTGANAWVLLAMADGASLTLRPDSQLKFDTYRYDREGDAAKNTSVLSLVKGALRSITGYIGRTNRAGYVINTPTATLGIRGTDHEPAYYPPPGPGQTMEHEPGTYDKVNDGESFIRNPKGEISVKKGQFAFVHHNRQFAPRILARAPVFYQRHIEFDRKAEKRREQFHRKFEDEHKRWQQERAQRNPQRQDTKQQVRDKEKQARVEKQQQRREQFEQRKQERAQVQEQRREQRAEELKSRRQEREEKRGGKKGREDEEERRRR
jgi:hypothetical protein